MKLTNDNPIELLLKTSELLNSSNKGFKKEFQVVKVKATPNSEKDREKGFQNIANWFANRFLTHYGALKVVISDSEVVYYFCISNSITELLDAKRLLINGTRCTFESVEILPIMQGSEAVVVHDLSSLLIVQSDMLALLAKRHKVVGKKSWSILCDKLPPIAVRKYLTTETES